MAEAHAILNSALTASPSYGEEYTKVQYSHSWTRAPRGTLKCQIVLPVAPHNFVLTNTQALSEDLRRGVSSMDSASSYRKHGRNYLRSK